MSPYGNLAGDKSGSNGFKMAWGRVKGKDANVGEIIRETVLLKALSTSVCSLDWKKKTIQCNIAIIYLLSAFMGSELVQSVVVHRNSLPCPSLLLGAFTLRSRNMSKLWKVS